MGMNLQIWKNRYIIKNKYRIMFNIYRFGRLVGSDEVASNGSTSGDRRQQMGGKPEVSRALLASEERRDPAGQALTLRVDRSSTI
jgi:hypothetical protein